MKHRCNYCMEMINFFRKIVTFCFTRLGMVSVLPKKYRSTAGEVLQYLLESTIVLLKKYWG